MEIKKALRIKNNKGAALIYTMMFLLLMSVVVVGFSLISVNMYKTTATSASKTQSFMFAKAIGQAFALQLTDDIDATTIVSYLEANTQYASTVKGSAQIKFNPEDGSNATAINAALSGTGLTSSDLANIYIPDAKLKFYFKNTCANCGANLEDLQDSAGNKSNKCYNCSSTNKNINKRYLYLDVAVSYNGATEVVTTVFTYLDTEDFIQTMYDLFSVYNIYSTTPREMEFDFSTDLVNPSNSDTYPNVYLYNGVDIESEGAGSIAKDTYEIYADVRANLTSTGDVKIKSNGSQPKSIYGTVTSYGSMELEHININDIYIKNDLTVKSTAMVNKNIYARSDVLVDGSDKTKTLVAGTIYAMGDVTIKNCVVGDIIGGAGSTIKLYNATCSRISTGGNVILEGSKVNTTVYCGGNLTITDSSVYGQIEDKGDLVVKLNSGDIQLGSVKTIDNLHVCGNATFSTPINSSIVGQITILGNVVIDGGIKYSITKKLTKIDGNLHVRGYISEEVSGLDCHVSYLYGFDITGHVLLSSIVGGKACIPLFGNKNGSISSSEPKTNIAGTLTIYGNMILGDKVTDFGEKESTVSISSYSFSDVDRYINLNGATIGSINTQVSGVASNDIQLFIKNGTVKNSINANQIILSGFTVPEGCKINAIKEQGAVIAVDNTKIYGQVVASTLFSLHRGSIIYATNTGFVHVPGHGTIAATAYIDGEVYGELVVGTLSNLGDLFIKSNAVLGANELDKAIYINGNLTVRPHLASAITNNPEQYAPRLRTSNGKGNKIYLSNGKPTIGGWVYDLYIKDGQPIEYMDEATGYCGKRYVKGSTYEETSFVAIGSKGLADSEGKVYPNSNVIVYVYETMPGNEMLGDLTIPGTLIVKKGVTFKCRSLKVNKVITDYDGPTLRNDGANFGEVKETVSAYVESYNYANTTITNFTIAGDTQINHAASGSVTVSNSRFDGWLKFKNVTGTINFNNSSVTGSVHKTYGNGNDSYRGCLDCVNANLNINSSYVGGTSAGASSQTATQNGTVYCKVLSMSGGKVYGNVYCSYAKTFENDSSNKAPTINGRLQMNIGSSTSVTWDSVYVLNSVYGNYVSVTMNSGVLCGSQSTSSVGSSNLDSNAYFVYLQDINMPSSSAVVASYASVFIGNGSNSQVCGQTIGNIYANTTKLNILNKSNSTTVAGYLYCKGTLTYSVAITSPGAALGVYANNTDTVPSLNAFQNITKGGITMPNYTKELTVTNVKGNIYMPKATVTVRGNVEDDPYVTNSPASNTQDQIYVNNLNISPTTSVKLTGNIYVVSDLTLSSSYTTTFGASNVEPKSIYVGKVMNLYSTTYVYIYQYVKCGQLVCNYKKSDGSEITYSEQSINPTSFTRKLTSTTKYIKFANNVRVVLGSGGGNAYLSNCEFKGCDSVHYGATLYTDRSVLAYYTTFKAAGYVSAEKHTYTTALKTYNTNADVNPSTYYGSIVSGLARSGSCVYGLYLSNCYVYSNVVQLNSSLPSYLNSSYLGETINADGAYTNLQLRNYTKYYYFAGNLTLSGTYIYSITATGTKVNTNKESSYNGKTDPLGYTILSVGGSLDVKSSSSIGTYFSTPRAHNHTGFKGVYVANNMKIDSGCSVYLNIYCKGNLNNAGKIQLQTKIVWTWETWNGWDREIWSCCGGQIQVGSYTNSGGTNSMEDYGRGVTSKHKTEKNPTYTYSEHNNTPREYDDDHMCTYNKGAFKKGSGVASAPNYNSTTTSAEADKKVTIAGACSYLNLPSTLPSKQTYSALPGVEWESMESLAGKTKSPKASLSYSSSSYAAADRNLVNQSSLAKERLNTENRSYWYPQAIPLRWYLPTQTTAGEAVALNKSSNNIMTVTEKKLGQSIDHLEAARDILKDLASKSIWELGWDLVTGDLKDDIKSLISNVGGFFTNLPTLFKPSSKYLGLKFKSKTDAYYYRTTATNISDILGDANGKDMMVITRRSLVANDFIPGDKLYNWLIEHTGWKEGWRIPTSYTLNQRPVGLVFFNSGIVPSTVFDGTTYRKYKNQSSEIKDGKWSWGNDASGWTAGLSAANDVTWTFFTCEDPRNPYTSAAKDLHIILPANTKMIWEKDGDSCVSIIGNGRVFLYLQENTDIKVVGNGFTHWLHDGINGNQTTSNIASWLTQWSNGDPTYNVFGGVRMVATIGSGLDERTYYDSNGKILMDEKATEKLGKRDTVSGQIFNVQYQPRMYIVGTGGNITFEVQDFQTAAYVYMPSGYSYGNKNARNVFKVTSDKNRSGADHWDIYGMYVCDNFAYDNGTHTKVKYKKTAPDLSNTVFKYTTHSKTSVSTTAALGKNRSYYQLAEFWDYPTDLPVSSMNWYYRGIAIS